MGVIADITPGSLKEKRIQGAKTYKQAKQWVQQELFQAVNAHVRGSQGFEVTYLQEGYNQILNAMVDPETDIYAKLAILKFTTEQLAGKAPTRNDEEKQEMPQFVICVQDTKVEEIKKAAKELEHVEVELLEDDILVEISDADGSNPEGYIFEGDEDGN